MIPARGPQTRFILNWEGNSMQRPQAFAMTNMLWYSFPLAESGLAYSVTKLAVWHFLDVRIGNYWVYATEPDHTFESMLVATLHVCLRPFTGTGGSREPPVPCCSLAGKSKQAADDKKSWYSD